MKINYYGYDYFRDVMYVNNVLYSLYISINIDVLKNRCSDINSKTIVIEINRNAYTTI